MNKTNVTEIHLCHRCPRLLGYQLAGRKNAWKVGLKGLGHFPSTIFHDRIARVFVEKIISSQDSTLRKHLATAMKKGSEDLPETIYALVDQYVLEPFLMENASKMPDVCILALAKGVKAWCRYLAQFLITREIDDKTRASSRIAEIFSVPEANLEQGLKLENGLSIKVRGRLDTVLFDPADKEAVIIEFKGYKPEHDDEDFIQLALYAWLFREHTGVSPKGVVLYLDEERPEAAYSSMDLEQVEDNLKILIRTTIEVKQATGEKKHLPQPHDPQLCSICPFDQTCDHDWGNRSEPPSPDQEENNEAATLMTNLITVLNKLKLPAEPRGYISGPRLIRLRIKPILEKGATVRKIMNKAEDLQVALSLKSAPLIRAQAGYLSLDAPRKFTVPLTLGELWEKGLRNRPISSVAFPMGLEVDGTVSWADLTNPTMTSILVAGTAGSGKSIFLRSVVIGLALNAGPDQVRVTLIDPKRVTFTDLTGLPHLAGPIIMDSPPALEALESLVEEMERRYHLFESESVADITLYNQRRPLLPHQVVIIDEYADLIIDKKTKPEAESFIQRLGQKGRAAGIHLILATQRPDAKVVTPLVKANLQLKVALKVTSAANSQIVLDEPGAERLMGNGDMLVGGAIPLARLQGGIPTKTEIQAAIAGREAFGSA
ncbi:MAG: PD-(D/E)XK nuclease family protein [Deltaproteobacteria bacterium]|nr:PD-(D/E)XK nuclease family protein [Deltaproteobacteria bacterium]